MKLRSGSGVGATSRSRQVAPHKLQRVQLVTTKKALPPRDERYGTGTPRLGTGQSAKELRTSTQVTPHTPLVPPPSSHTPSSFPPTLYSPLYPSSSSSTPPPSSERASCSAFSDLPPPSSSSPASTPSSSLPSATPPDSSTSSFSFGLPIPSSPPPSSSSPPSAAAPPLPPAAVSLASSSSSAAAAAAVVTATTATAGATASTAAIASAKAKAAPAPARAIASAAAAKLSFSSLAASVGLHPDQSFLQYCFQTKWGSKVNVSVTHGKERVVVKIAYKTGFMAKHVDKPLLHWGVFRGTPDKSYHPKESIPPDSLVDEGSGGMRSPLHWNEAAHAWCAELSVATKLLPLQLSTSIFDPVWKQYDSPVHGLSHVVPLGMSPGQAKPLGSSVSVQQGLPVTEGRHNVNFAVFSRDAVSMTLCLVRIEPAVSSASNAKGLTYMEIALDPHTNKTGDLWHTCVHGLKDIGTLTYGWKADGAAAWSGGGKFHGGYLLLDPYATQAVSLVLPETYWKVANKLPPSPKHDLPVLLGSLAPLAPQKKLPGPPLTGLNRPPKSNRVIVEVDVRTFATGPEVRPEAQGKLLGVLDKLPLLLEAGATTVLLSPISLGSKGAEGSLSLFAPDPSLAVGGALSVADELKQVIASIHSIGIEVLLQLELCTTGEGADGVGQSGLQGLHGLGGDVYYRRSPDGIEVLRVGHPVVRQLVMDALHFWAKEYCVDGFCILKAENLAQDREGLIMDNPALPEEIAHDPVLKRLQLIVVPSNPSLLPRNGERGFPHWGVWAQWNPSFAFDMHNYVVNNKSGLMSKLATIITGSPDLLSARWDGGLPGALATGRPPSHAMNTVAPLGSTAALPALLALERGVPGGGPPKPNSPPPQWNDVLARTLLLSMFTSLGTPCFSAATVVSDPALRRFVGVLGVLRQSLAELLAPPFHDSPRQLRWHGAKTDSQPDWTGKSSTPHANCIAFSVRNDNGRAVYVALNPYNEKVYMALPVPPDGMAWKCVINTGGPPPGDAIVPTDEGLPSLATQPLNNSRQQVVLEPLAGALVMAIGRPS